VAKEYYFRSEQTNELFDKLFIQHRVGIVLTIPDVGEVRLRGDVARKFLWTLRSHKATFLIDDWLNELKGLAKDIKRPVEPQEPDNAEA
jgi:hypothetical protein